MNTATAPRAKALLVVTFVLFLGCHPMFSQLALSLTNSATTVLVSNSVTLTIDVTNLDSLAISNIAVTNQMAPSGAAHFTGANFVTSLTGSITTNADSVVFSIASLPGGAVAEMMLTILPTAAGFITNTVTVSGYGLTNLVSTHVVVQATNPPAARTDLAVSIVPPTLSVLPGDYITYTVNVTNQGPNTASGIVVSNRASLVLNLIGVSPTNLTEGFTNGALVVNLDALGSQQSRTMRITVQPTNSGVLTYSATVSSPNISDSNPANNSATTTNIVEDFLPGDLSVGFVTNTQTFNPMTGLMEQTIRLSNNGTNRAPAARVSVTNLTCQLYNAAGTNRPPDGIQGNPFVIYASPLAPGQSADLLMEYFVPTGLPFSISTNQFFAEVVPTPDFTPGTLGTEVAASRILQLASGDIVVEFPSVAGRSYTVVYSDDVLFSNAMMALPSLKAPANRVQWIDYGPPGTVSPPAGSRSRFYRVYLSP